MHFWILSIWKHLMESQFLSTFDGVHLLLLVLSRVLLRKKFPDLALFLKRRAVQLIASSSD
jgi:hypothetical protein